MNKRLHIVGRGWCEVALVCVLAVAFCLAGGCSREGGGRDSVDGDGKAVAGDKASYAALRAENEALRRENQMLRRELISKNGALPDSASSRGSG